jgi:hypothetical protein
LFQSGKSILTFNLQAGGFGLLVIGPSYIPANEVSLFFLIETILGEQWGAAFFSSIPNAMINS